MPFKTRFNVLAVMFVALCFSLNAVAQTTVVGSVPAEFNVSGGTANYSIPIQVAPGRGGMQPELSLNYSSAGGNGVLGLSWSLGGLSVIHRCSASLAQDGFISGINFDEKDRYCLNGQRLVPINGANGGVGTEYRTEVDSYSQIISMGGVVNDPDHFVVKTKAGHLITYGTGNSAEKLQQGTVSWSVSEINDTTGNNPISYSYFVSAGEPYLSRVTYAGGRILVNYEERNDRTKKHYLGETRFTQYRITAIDVFSVDSPMQKYSLTYENNSNSEYSRLSMINVCSSNTYPISCFSPIVFDWESTNTSFDSTVLSDVLDWGYKEGRSWVDFNGDGLTDFCRVVGSSGNGHLKCTLSTAQGFGDTVTSAVLDWGYTDSRWWIDFNGDGLADYCRRVGSGSSQRISCTLSAGSSFGETITSNNLDLGYLAGRDWVDFNRDGLLDYCRVVGSSGSNRVQCTLSSGNGFGSRSPPTLCM